MKIIGKEFAYPSSVCCNENGIYSGADCNGSGNGLTIRQQFAMAAMQGCSTIINSSFQEVAEWSVKCADALIAELNRTEE